ncbi:MAG: hypothetical protein F2806_09205 [Actinobacteria bacterium]|uniref:Unannotated protein n=1 Tax=freshwater metagenome TaxID=449393 RepID=A0A6J7HBA0_9ZZZZ|nr:hypothetical protein [Actinomycetota bacterium]
MPEQTPREPLTAKEKKAKRLRDLWQLDIPLVIAIALCTTFTAIEVRRAGEGVGRAWAYSIQWPLIGIICCWIWYRYRTEGNVTQGFTSKWKTNLRKLEIEAHEADRLSVQEQPKFDEADPELQEWRDYVDDLHRREPPGGPDNQKT